MLKEEEEDGCCSESRAALNTQQRRRRIDGADVAEDLLHYFSGLLLRSSKLAQTASFSTRRLDFAPGGLAPHFNVTSCRPSSPLLFKR